MGLDEVTAHARERLGLEIQAVTRLGARQAGTRHLEVWSLMTEYGKFWLVEDGGQVELLRASRGERGAVSTAVQRFLELHPTVRVRPKERPRREAHALRLPHVRGAGHASSVKWAGRPPAL